MSSNRRPWYPWYPKDFIVDEKVQSLSDDAELLYRRVLDLLWQANDLQMLNNCSKLANALCKNWTKDRFDLAWEEIQTPGFELLKTSNCGNFVYSKRLLEEAQKIENISKTRAKAAKAKHMQSKSRAKAEHVDCHTDTDIKEINKEKFPFRFKVKVPIPKDFRLTQDMVDHAKGKNFIGDLDGWTEDMILSATAKGYKYKDWHATWKNWFNSHIKKHPEQVKPEKVWVDI